MNKTEFIEQYRAIDDIDYDAYMDEATQVMEESYRCDGAVKKLMLAQEECAELILAISKHMRGYPDIDMDILEEMADVTIMLGYIGSMLGFTKNDLDKAILVKIRREKKRLDEMQK